MYMFSNNIWPVLQDRVALYFLLIFSTLTVFVSKGYFFAFIGPKEHPVKRPCVVQQRCVFWPKMQLSLPFCVAPSPIRAYYCHLKGQREKVSVLLLLNVTRPETECFCKLEIPNSQNANVMNFQVIVFITFNIFDLLMTELFFFQYV